MADTQETIADIVRKMRNEIAELRNVSPNVPSIAADWWEARVDEIEAAHKRELSKNASKKRADFGQLGDAAKLRNACANIAEYARAAMCHATDTHVLGYLNQIEGWAKAALSAPPRNCDRFATADEAFHAWNNTVDTPGGGTYVGLMDWLYAPATEQEGGKDAD